MSQKILPSGIHIPLTPHISLTSVLLQLVSSTQGATILTIIRCLRLKDTRILLNIPSIDKLSYQLPVVVSFSVVVVVSTAKSTCLYYWFCPKALKGKNRPGTHIAQAPVRLEWCPFQ